MRRTHRILLAVAATLLLIAAASRVLADSSNTAPTPTIFRDTADQVALAINLDLGQPTGGSFDFLITGMGDYTGTMPVQETGGSNETLHGTVPVTFQPAGSGTPRMTNLRMEGYANMAAGSATINVWVDGNHYTIVVGQVTESSALPVAQEAVSAMSAGNWNALYSLLSSAIQARYTQAAFAQEMAADMNYTVTSLQLTGTGQISTVAGYTYDSEPIAFTIKKADGATTRYTASLSLVLDGSAWKMLGTSTPVTVP